MTQHSKNMYKLFQLSSDVLLAQLWQIQDETFLSQR